MSEDMLGKLKKQLWIVLTLGGVLTAGFAVYNNANDVPAAKVAIEENKAAIVDNHSKTKINGKALEDIKPKVDANEKSITEMSPRIASVEKDVARIDEHGSVGAQQYISKQLAIEAEVKGMQQQIQSLDSKVDRGFDRILEKLDKE